MTRIGHHAAAVDANGRSIPDRIWGHEMPVLADFPSMLLVDGEFVRDDSTDGLDQAREWAAKVIAEDSRIAAVSIRQSVQEWDGASWKAGRHVETIERPAAAPEPSCQGRGHIWPTYQVGRCACGAVSTD